MANVTSNLPIRAQIILSRLQYLADVQEKRFAAFVSRKPATLLASSRRQAVFKTLVDNLNTRAAVANLVQTHLSNLQNLVPAEGEEEPQQPQQQPLSHKKNTGLG